MRSGMRTYPSYERLRENKDEDAPTESNMLRTTHPQTDPTAMLSSRRRHAPWQRRHGFQRPLHVSQLLAAGGVVMSATTFYAFGVWELPTYMQKSVALLFTAQSVMVVLLFIIITFLDPAHSAVTRRQAQDRAAQQHPTQDTRLAADEAAAATDDTTFRDRPSPSRRIKCTLCRVFVSTGTRHCSTCNKCIAGFDHHCVYLNTCIGSRNYPLFIGLLSCTILLISTQMIVTGFAIARLAHAGSRHYAARIASLCCLSLLPFLQLFCMLVLASFHVYLSVKGVKTHECLQQWYRSRAESSANTSSATYRQGQEKPKVAVTRVNSINKTPTDPCAASDTSSTDLESSGALEEEEACAQVDTSHACEPMSILIGPEDQLFDMQQHEADERQKYLV